MDNHISSTAWCGDHRFLPSGDTDPWSVVVEEYVQVGKLIKKFEIMCNQQGKNDLGQGLPSEGWILIFIKRPENITDATSRNVSSRSRI